MLEPQRREPRDKSSSGASFDGYHASVLANRNVQATDPLRASINLWLDALRQDDGGLVILPYAPPSQFAALPRCGTFDHDDKFAI